MRFFCSTILRKAASTSGLMDFSWRKTWIWPSTMFVRRCGIRSARFGDDERGGGFGAESQAEAVVGGGSFFGLGGVGGEIPAGSQGVFDEERALGAVFVAGGVDRVLAGGAV